MFGFAMRTHGDTHGEPISWTAGRKPIGEPKRLLTHRHGESRGACFRRAGAQVSEYRRIKILQNRRCKIVYGRPAQKLADRKSRSEAGLQAVSELEGGE